MILVCCSFFQPPSSPEIAPGVNQEKDIQYGQANGQQLFLDLYAPSPSAEGTRTAVIYIHGGGWAGGTKQGYTDMARSLAAQGYVGFSIDYRLASDGRNTFPAAYDDAQRAVRWVRAHASEYQIDPNRIVLLGDSAGGHLAALLGTTDTRDNSDAELADYSSRPACVINFFGPADLTSPFPTRTPDGANIQQVVEAFMGGTAVDMAEQYRQGSPIFHVDAKTVPFLILHGTEDAIVPVDQSRRFFSVLQQAGVEAQYLELPGEVHGFQKKESWDIVFPKMLEFLQHCSQ